MVRVKIFRQFLDNLPSLEEEVNSFLSGRGIYDIRTEIVANCMYVYIIYNDGEEDGGFYGKSGGEDRFKN